MKALIFDLDGTLLNTIADLHQSTNYALRMFGYPERSLEEVNSFVGNGLAMLIRKAVPAGTPEETVQSVLKEMKSHYAEHYHDLTVPYPGIMDLLEVCKDKGIPMAIVSNKADPFVKKLRFHIHFRLIIKSSYNFPPWIKDLRDTPCFYCSTKQTWHKAQFQNRRY